MPIAVQKTTSHPNMTTSFTFEQDVLSYIVGVAYWKFSFKKKDHRLKRLSLNLTNNKPNPRQIDTRISAKLQDDSGNDISDSDSSILAVCVAITAAQDNNITLANAYDIASGANSASVPLPGSSLSIANSFLSGWDLDLGSSHDIKQLTTSSGFVQNGNMGMISSHAQLKTNSGEATTGHIDGGLIATTPSERALLGKSLSNQQSWSKVPVTFDQPLSGAAVLLESLSVEYPRDDHDIRSIGGGCWAWEVKGNTVELYSPHAFMRDDGGNHQDDSTSHVSMLVLGIPA